MRPSSKLRTDIQGLRAVAVLLVFFFHTWPERVPGGFVGVDVFFVVSGYLVVGLLLRELSRDGRVDLLRFYRRRVRRLLPVATVVLAAVGALTPFLLPATRWRDAARDVVASVFYVQNWHLAGRAVDYHAIDLAPSPLQHFWSLSIEEQFYLACPALLWGAARVSRRGPEALLAAIFLASLAFSVGLDHTSASYFVTHTRAWELALGGLLAAAPTLRASWLGFPGLIAVVASAFVLGPSTPFPGWAALLPTVGCAALLATEGRGRTAALLGLRPLRWIGDRSYSIYLWHWPLVVVWTASGNRLGATATVVIGVATAVLSALSYRWVEERFRHGGSGAPRVRALGLGSLAPLALSAWILRPIVGGDADAAHPGGAVLFGAPLPPVVSPIPHVANVRESRHRDHLLTYVDATPHPRTVTPGTTRIALVGDSHAQHWEPAMHALALARGWSLTVHAKMACPLLEQAVTRQDKPYSECAQWAGATLELLDADPPDAIVLSHSSRHRVWGEPKGHKGDRATMEAMQSVWARLNGNGSSVVHIPDLPRWPRDPVECFLEDPACRLPIREHSEYGRDLVRRGARGREDVRVLNLYDMVCPANVCEAVIGNVFVYRDTHHLTEEYAASLADELGRRLDELLPELAATEPR